jgi:carboxyl-terminal processing protease
MKKFKILLQGRRKIAIAAALIILLTGGFAFVKDNYFEISKSIELFGLVYKEVSFNYVDEISPEEFMKAGIRGMLSSLDPYTVYLDEKNKGDIDLLTNGKYGGIGVSIGLRNDRATILELMDGYAAQRQGVRIGDVILSVDGKEISKDNFDKISTFVKGEPGTTIELKVMRDDEKDTLKFHLVREEITVKSLAYAGFYPEASNNVYLKLTSFSRSSGDEIKKALLQLKSQKQINSVVLDLRGNPGGLLDVAVDISNKFISKGALIVSTKGRDTTQTKLYYANQEPILPDAKLVVLINEGSASASEIVAGAIQDHDRGVILGLKSFGKGLVQTITPLVYNSSLKITTAKYYTPSGRSIQKIDYSKRNDVFAKTGSIINSNYLTDNRRTVFSAGGITPDTTVDDESPNGIIRFLQAKGSFFKFANQFANQNDKDKFENTGKDKLFSEFENFIKNGMDDYKSDQLKKVEQLIESSKDDKSSKEVSENLNQLKKHYENKSKQELKTSKNEVIEILKSELAARYYGAEGRIKKSLEFDRQMITALKVVKDNDVYKKLLNSNK